MLRTQKCNDKNMKNKQHQEEYQKKKKHPIWLLSDISEMKWPTVIAISQFMTNQEA